ncbi:8-oxo-dGTP pyrophosphatase MutT (NUDIX family) [Geomicrobium halophilum]|uniref:8-oxo-dGTP pyrophosphatase MutT (NUDIX family) n=1 Tax=Geomicrobium halophilum TaxID=549000 RepID=A0A841PI70_9BACL|nr:CoA pyrophosphatase [Geomicrobium halophilum]MBB6448577.1 8-oxo-dGTP pyrophosphatase MutT (NUDIX family) [Geomicrobium halophilum]
MSEQINQIFARLKKHEGGIIGESEAQHSAVALPIVLENQKPSLLFQTRSYHLKNQPGDICFPGGKMEEQDLNSAETAVRELCEETGIKRLDATHIASLDKWMMPYGIVIHPHVFSLTDTSFAPNDEVEELFTVPIDALLNQKPEVYTISSKAELPEDFPYEKIPGGKDYPFRQTRLPEIFYEYKGKHIWGLTARILQHFLRVGALAT